MGSLSSESLTDVVAFIDPASGKPALKKTAARSADVVVGQDDLRRVFVLHAWAGRIPTTAHTDRIFKLVDDFHPRIIGIDASAMQSLYADSLLREAKQRGKRIPLLPVKMVGDKDARIRSVLQRVVSDGRLFVQATQRELWQELESFPSGLTKDIVDALAEAITLLPHRPEPAAKHAEGEKFLDYLRDSGAPSWYVREAAQSYHKETDHAIPRRR